MACRKFKQFLRKIVCKSLCKENQNDSIENIEKEGADSYLKETAYSRQYLNLRRCWSVWIGLLLGVSLGFVCFLVWFVGKDYLNYVKYPWLIEIVIGSFLIEFIGLAFIVTTHLFPRAPQTD